MAEQSSPPGETPAKNVSDPETVVPTPAASQLSDAELDAVSGGTGATPKAPGGNDIDKGVKVAVDL